MDVGHPETREGLVGLLLTVAVWSRGTSGTSSRRASRSNWRFTSSDSSSRCSRSARGSTSVPLTPAAPASRTLQVACRRRVRGDKSAEGHQPAPRALLHDGVGHRAVSALAIRHELLYWAVLGLSYAIIAVGFFMLIEQFYYAGADSRPLVALISITAIPTVATVFGGAVVAPPPLMYERAARCVAFRRRYAVRLPPAIRGDPVRGREQRRDDFPR